LAEVKKKGHLEVTGVNNRKNRNYSEEIGYENMEWIKLAQNRGQWRTLVHTRMKLGVP
jgi:hypothetical protein